MSRYPVTTSVVIGNRGYSVEVLSFTGEDPAIEQITLFAKDQLGEITLNRTELAALRTLLDTLDEREVEEAENPQDAQAWEEDEKDMARIAREWSEYDRDPPGS